MIIFEDAKKKAFLQEAQIMKVTLAGFQSALEGRMVGLPLTGKADALRFLMFRGESRSSRYY